MKINKIIFISYFSVIGLLLLSLMMMGYAFNDAKYAYHRVNQLNIETKTQTLQHFQHVFVSDDCRVSFKNAPETKLTYITMKDSSLVEPVFKLRNDTLFVISTKSNMHYGRVTLSCSHLLSITGKNSHITLENMEQPTLCINAVGTTIDIRNEANIKKYDLTLKQSSDFHCWNHFKADELKVDVQGSKLRIRAEHKLSIIKGLVTNHSTIELPEAKSYQLEVDETSKLNIF